MAASRPRSAGRAHAGSSLRSRERGGRSVSWPAGRSGLRWREGGGLEAHGPDCVGRAWCDRVVSLSATCERERRPSRAAAPRTGCGRGPSPTDTRPPCACEIACTRDSPSPAPPDCAGAGGVAAGEALEGLAVQLRRQARAVVLDGEHHLLRRGVLGDADGDRRARGRVPAGVVEQVGQHLVQPLLVAGRDHRLVGQVELPPVVRADDAGVAHGLEGQPGEVDLVAGQRSARVEAGEQQQVLDQAGHPGRLGLDLGHRERQLLGVGRAGAAAQLGVPVDGRQRRAQLVGGVGDELPHLLLAAVPLVEGVLDVLEHRVQRGADLADLGALVGERVGHPDRRTDLAAGQRQRRDLVRGRRHLAQRPQLPADEEGAGDHGDADRGQAEEHLVRRPRC